MGDFGGKLRQARERRGVSLRQISAATKISVGALEALERNDVAKLPGGIFSRAFVRSYASEVGLDPDQTIRDFVLEFAADEADSVQFTPPAAPPVVTRASEPKRQAPPPAPREPIRRTRPSVEIVPDESEFESQQRMASVVLRLLMVSVPLVLVILYFSLRGPAPAANANVPAARPAPEDAPPPPAPLDPAVALQGAATAGREPATALGPPAPIPSASPDQQTIELRPGAPCWVSLTVDGTPSFTREMQAGERVVRTFREEAVLKVGDGAACEFALNGRIAKPLGAAGQPRTIKITPQNVTSYLP
jgi:cytoskeleton protein RodZ